MDLDDSIRVEILKNVTELLLKLGFQARQKGYRYLREAVLLTVEDPVYIAMVTKLLYPKIAKRYDTTDKQVERAIRNAIETAWTNGNPEELEKVFGDLYMGERVRPTNKEVIGRIRAYLERKTVEDAQEIE